MARDNPADLILIRAERDSMQNQESGRETRETREHAKRGELCPAKKCDDLGRKEVWWYVRSQVEEGVVVVGYGRLLVGNVGGAFEELSRPQNAKLHLMKGILMLVSQTG